MDHEPVHGGFRLTTVHLPTDAKERKALPIITGCFDYFPDALVEVAELSRIGNDQHNPGQPLHWSKHKSTDHADCLGRHLIDRGTRDTDGVRHSVKVAWRALAMVQIEIEAERAGLSVPEYLAMLKREAEAKQPVKTGATHCDGPGCGADKGKPHECVWTTDCSAWCRAQADSQERLP